MTPRPMQTSIVARRLHLMAELISDLEEIGEVTALRLEEARMVRHALEPVTRKEI